jgi:hypothetical protein
MRNAVLSWLLVLFFATDQTMGHDLGGGDSLVDPSGFVETARYLVQYESSDGALAELPRWADRESYLKEEELGDFLFADKDTSKQGRYDFVLDGGKEPWFRGIENEDYCGVEVLLVFVQRDMPRYGGMLGRWLTTYSFRADTFEFLKEYDGTPYDITRFDSRVVPEVDSIMDERYLVSCLPAGRERPFSFGLIDRERLYGPDWCGPKGERCRVKAPTASGGN